MKSEVDFSRRRHLIVQSIINIPSCSTHVLSMCACIQLVGSSIQYCPSLIIFLSTKEWIISKRFWHEQFYVNDGLWNYIMPLKRSMKSHQCWESFCGIRGDKVHRRWWWRMYQYGRDDSSYEVALEERQWNNSRHWSMRRNFNQPDRRGQNPVILSFRETALHILPHWCPLILTALIPKERH